ncbi:putative heat shock protein 70 [Olive leaf yellowing-associated virus]|uniref:Putative heat shock protein 70 n=1 Tax=Olive leaf yellowing-associated virus TaxID=82791 RepID=Q8QL58_9CLOS|nr:putative heat shock protein 70 [Olive leaf yellowing-associated virus]CAD29309.1 putative heat shock protein 70 [Olive leaf yellowing-associated virus]
MTVLGLDFGTTFSTVCLASSNEVLMLNNDDSEFIPTIIGFSVSDDTIVYGYDAITRDGYGRQGFSVYRDLKRWIGVNSKTLSERRAKLKPLYNVTCPGVHFSLRIDPTFGQPRLRNLHEIVSFFIALVVRDFEKLRNFRCSGLVISVPSQYTSTQRFFMKTTEERTGLPVFHIMNEPSAALFASMLDMKKTSDWDSYVVYDFGGGTFDTSIVLRYGNYYSVIYSCGDDSLGGRDVDEAIRTFLLKRTSLPSTTQLSVSQLKEEVSVTGKPSSILFNGLRLELTFEDLTRLTRPFLERSFIIMNKVIKDSGIRGRLTLVPAGGSSFLPGAVTLAEKAIRAVERVITPKRARSAIAEGCALFSATLSERSVLFVDCINSNITSNKGLYQARIIVAAGSALPLKAKLQGNYDDCDLSFTLALYEGTSNRNINNFNLLKKKIESHALGYRSGAWGWIANVEVDTSGSIEVRITNKEGAYTMVDSVKHSTFTLITLPSYKPKVKESIKQVVLINDFVAGCYLEKSFLKNTSVLTQREYLKFLQNLTTIYEPKVLKTLLVASSFNGTTSIQSYLERRRPVPEFLRDPECSVYTR